MFTQQIEHLAENLAQFFIPNRGHDQLFEHLLTLHRLTLRGECFDSGSSSTQHPLAQQHRIVPGGD